MELFAIIVGCVLGFTALFEMAAIVGLIFYRIHRNFAYKTYIYEDGKRK